MAESSVAFDAKYNNWKNKLLDLGRRNRLVSYKNTKMSTLRILSPSCVALYESFAIEEQPIEFPREHYIDGESTIEICSYGSHCRCI